MRVVTDMAQMLKMSRTPSTVREPEPTLEAAREYTEGTLNLYTSFVIVPLPLIFLCL